MSADPTTARRVATVERLKLLERKGDPSLTAFTRIASFVVGSGSAAVHVFDDHAQHRVAATNAPLGEHPRHDAMCTLVVDEEQTIVCADATLDERFAHSSFVLGMQPPPVRFYISVPLRMADGTVVGTLCAWDTVAHELTDEQHELYEALADQVAAFIQLMRIAVDLGDAATRDPLTGAVNRLLLDDRLAGAFARQARRGGKVLVAVLDVDEFKSINDVHGHDAGDAVLVAIAERLREAMRDEDTVARLGGDEFAVIAEVTPEGISAEDLIARIEHALDEPVVCGDAPRRVGVTVGAAFAEPGDGVREALERADALMYARKRAGGARARA